MHGKSPSSHSGSGRTGEGAAGVEWFIRLTSPIRRSARSCGRNVKRSHDDMLQFTVINELIAQTHVYVLSNRRTNFMSSTTDKIKGAADKAIGTVKSSVGSAVGSDKMVVEGEAQKVKGHAETAVGDAKDAVKDTADKAADAVRKI